VSSPERSDWTCDESGRSNSSEAFVGLVAAVESLIRGEAASLIAGRADTVAGLIVAQLAHAHGLIPEENAEGLLDAIERLNATIERQEKELADLRAIASLDPDALRDAEAENDRLRSQLEDREERLRTAADLCERERREADRWQTHPDQGVRKYQAGASWAFGEALTALRTDRET
jgi:hypothetical protein